MKPSYIQIPNYSIADIGKVGSSSIYRAVLRTFHPDRIPVSVGYDMSNQPNDGGRQRVDRTTEPENTVLLFVREPVDRFRSACAQSRIEDVEKLLTHLENGTGEAGLQKIPFIESYHFRPQSDYRATGRPTKAFKFPNHVAEFVLTSGLDDLPVANDAGNNPAKPELTPEQQSWVESIYADDIALFETITEAGQDLEVVEIPPEPVVPATPQDKTAKIRELESLRYQAEITGITLPDGKFVLTDKETQAELGKALSIISTVNPSLEIDWKFPDGEVVHMDATQIQQIAGAVFAHVQTTRTAFKDKVAEVEAATTEDELDAITF